MSCLINKIWSMTWNSKNSRNKLIPVMPLKCSNHDEWQPTDCCWIIWHIICDTVGPIYRHNDLHHVPDKFGYWILAYGHSLQSLKSLLNFLSTGWACEQFCWLLFCHLSFFMKHSQEIHSSILITLYIEEIINFSQRYKGMFVDILKATTESLSVFTHLLIQELSEQDLLGCWSRHWGYGGEHQNTSTCVLVVIGCKSLASGIKKSWLKKREKGESLVCWNM